MKYIESLIGANTINTIPVETLNDYREHGNPKNLIEQDILKARWMLEQLSHLGINIDTVTQQLEDEGIEKFNRSFDKLMETLDFRCKSINQECDYGLT